MDAIPVEILFPATLIILFLAIELGYKLGNTHPEQVKKDKEKMTTSNTGAVLGLLGFILVFTFGIVYHRYDLRKELIIEEANQMRTVWMRSNFLPEYERIESKRLLKEYIDLRLLTIEAYDFDQIKIHINMGNQVQYRMWDIAEANLLKNVTSEAAGLYVQSLNDMMDQQAARIAVGIYQKIPGVIWILLYVFVIMGMFGVGYQASVSNSTKRSWLTPIMVLSFSLMIALISALDRPVSNIMKVPQQPILDAKSWIEEESKRH